MIGIVTISAIVGLFRGLLREAIAVVTWVAALWFAWHFGPDLEPHLGGVLESSGARPWAARVIIFFVVLLIGTAAGWLAAHFVRLSLFQGMDKLFGFIFGVLRGVLVIGALVILGHALKLHEDSWWKEAKLKRYAEGTADTLRSIVGDRPLERAQEMLLSTEPGK